VTVYVDDMRAPYGRMIMCHMIADTDGELHAMAQRVGVARKWHQAPPRHDSHYDICLAMRAKALSAGAVAITWRQAGSMTLRRRATGSLGSPEDAVAWCAAFRLRKKTVIAVDSPVQTFPCPPTQPR